MAVDVSGITSALINVPGQQVQGIQQQLEQAYKDKQAEAQQKLQNEMLAQKMHLEEKVKQGEIDLKQLETNAKQMDYVRGWAQGMLVTKDPAQRDMLLRQGITDAQKLSIPREGQLAMLKAAQEPEFAGSLIARGMAAKDFYKEYLADATNKDASQSEKKYKELIQHAKDNGTYIPGTTEKTAEGLAFGLYHTVPDQAEGGYYIADLRSAGGKVSPSQAAQIEGMGGVPKPDTNYSPVRVTTGNKMELRTQDKVQDLSRDMRQTGVLPAEAALQPIEATIASTFEKGKNLPGYGRLESGLPTKTLSWWDEEGKRFRQQVQALMNIDIHQFAGSAQSAQELARIQQKYAAGVLDDPAQLVAAIKAFRAGIEESKKSTFGGYDPTVVERYQSQGGVKLSGQRKVVTEEQIRANAVKYKWSPEQTEAAIKKYVRK